MLMIFLHEWTFQIHIIAVILDEELIKVKNTKNSSQNSYVLSLRPVIKHS